MEQIHGHEICEIKLYIEYAHGYEVYEIELYMEYTYSHFHAYI